MKCFYTFLAVLLLSISALNLQAQTATTLTYDQFKQLALVQMEKVVMNFDAYAVYGPEGAMLTKQDAARLLEAQKSASPNSGIPGQNTQQETEQVSASKAEYMRSHGVSSDVEPVQPSRPTQSIAQPSPSSGSSSTLVREPAVTAQPTVTTNVPSSDAGYTNQSNQTSQSGNNTGNGQIGKIAITQSEFETYTPERKKWILDNTDKFIITQ